MISILGKDKLTITVNMDVCELLELQTNIIDMVQCYNYEAYTPNNCPAFYLLNFLKETLPSYEDMKAIEELHDTQRLKTLLVEYDQRQNQQAVV